MSNWIEMCNNQYYDIYSRAPESRIIETSKVLLGNAEFGSSQPLLFALAAAVVGFGGFKVFTNRQGNVASKPNRAARGSKQQIKVSYGLTLPV